MTTSAHPVSGRVAPHASPFRNIAVVMNDMAGEAAALDSAAALASMHGAKLDLLQLVALPTPVVDAWALVPDPSFSEIYADIRKAAKMNGEAMRVRLASLGAQGDVRPIEVLYAEPADVAAVAARCCDLSVLARPYAAPGDTSVVHAYFAAMLLESGHPVLVVPADGPVTTAPRRALIAWSDTREAARALNDALPILKGCEHVDVLIVDPRATLLETADEAGSSVIGHLASHGIDASRVVAESRGRSIGSTVIDQAARRDADLIVAGGYGHSRLREWAMGGTTRDLFLSSPLPVFFSH